MGNPVSGAWHERLFSVDSNGKSMFVLVLVRGGADGLIDEICVQATDGKVALKGDVSQATLANSIEGKFKSYASWCNDTQCALIDGLSNYSIVLQSNALTWSRKQEDLTVQFYSLHLQPTDLSSIVGKMLMYAVHQSHYQSEMIAEVESLNSKLEAQRIEAIAAANVDKEKLEYLETELFGRFADVLNAKKSRITELLDSVDPDRVAPILTRLSGSSAKSGQQQSSDEVQHLDSDNGADTDTEKDMLSDRRAKSASKRSPAKSTTPKKRARKALQMDAVRTTSPRVTRNASRAKAQLQFDDGEDNEASLS